MQCKHCGTKLGPNKSLCPSCGQFTAVESAPSKVVRLSEAAIQPIQYIPTGPWDRCFGNSSNGEGIALGITYLLSGAPGGGKSTMLLQIAESFGKTFDSDVLIVGAEESESQMRDRAKRMGLDVSRMIVLPMVGRGQLFGLGEVLKEHKPCLGIVDSVSTMFEKDLGGAVQFTKQVIAHANGTKVPFILVNHVSKADDFSGLMALQHVVDATLTMYPVEDQTRSPEDEPPRIIRSIKNRVGGLTAVKLEMTEHGMIASHKGYRPARKAPLVDEM